MQTPTSTPPDREPPFVDAHSISVCMGRELVWARLLQRVEASPLLRSRQAFPVRIERPHEQLHLGGSHPFAAYQLLFDLAYDAGQTVVTARTSAGFPGRAGRIYRALIVSTGAHALIVRRFLADLRCGRPR